MAKRLASPANPAGERTLHLGEAVARTTFQKRQKEMKRIEKQRMKAERRLQRKLEKSAGTETPEEIESAPVESDLPEQPS
jgi:hypothetical protein